MIIDHITNIEQEEVNLVVDRSQEKNAVLKISAINVNPCAIDYSFISRSYNECAGIYLKWLNSQGGWSDHLFFKAYERSLKIKDLGSVQRYYSNRADAVSDFAHLGVEAFEEWELENKIPYESEEHRKELESIFTSHQVYLYTGKQYSGEIEWLLVKLKKGSYKTKENSLTYNELSVIIQLPKINTITL